MHPCLFCLSTKGPWTSVEHVFPASLGNKEIVLPKGVVCDTCNHTKLSRLDAALLEFEPIAFMRTYQRIPSKKGNLPSVSLPGFRMEARTPSHVHAVLDSEIPFTSSPVTSSGLRLPVGVEEFSYELRGKQRMDNNYLKLLSRPLFKITRGLIYLDHGPAIALSSRFDHVRQIVRGHAPLHGFLGLANNGRPSGGVKFKYQFCSSDEGPLTLILGSFYGVQVFTEMERGLRPAMPGPPGTTILTF